MADNSSGIILTVGSESGTALAAVLEPRQALALAGELLAAAQRRLR